MSDTTQPSAPPPQAPSAPSTPPPQAEVPVDQTPVSQPVPLGEQAPSKPPGQDSNKSSHIGRREAIQNAFAKAKQAQEEAAKTPRAKSGTDRPGMGHNQPPEAMAKEVADKTEKTGQPSEKQQRYREGGKFAKDPAKAEQTPPEKVEQPPPGQQPGVQPQQAQPVKPLDEKAPYREAPGRFRDQAKAEWHATPESVRAGVYQMAREFQGAYEKYRGDHDVMEQLRPYHDLAVKQGTSIRRAMDNYYGMEQKLRSDVIGGLDTIVRNLNIPGADGRPVTLTDIAHHVLTMTPEQHQLTQQRNQQTSAEMQIGQLHQQVAQQGQVVQQLLYEKKFAGTRAQVDQFAEAHPRFDELADLIKSELDLGFPLEQAYKRAEMLRPAHAAQTRTPSAQTRKTSISGAPDGGKSANPRPSDGQRRPNGEAKHPTRREAIAKAMRRVGNGV
jgi:hypothetical protein